MYTTQNCACENGWGLFWDVMHTQKLVWDRTVLVDLISDIISTKFQYLFERAYNSTIVLFGHTPKTLYDRLFFIKCKKGTISNPVWLLWCPETNQLFQFYLNESWKILHEHTLLKVPTAISRKVVGKSASDNPTAIADGFECTVLQRNLNEWYRMFAMLCLRLLKESNQSTFDRYSRNRNSVLIISHITFRDCRVHIFSDNLSRNNCIPASV